MKISILLTCHNRKEKTLSCLSSLFVALSYFNEINEENHVEYDIIVTDDGCTDGTADAIIEKFGNKVQILNGNGNLYWAGGMRLAWNEALKNHNNIDYYLLLNDDVILKKECLSILIETDEYCINKFKQHGIYSGITFSKTEPKVLTYSGCVWTNKFLGKMKMVGVSDEPQMVDVTNANILLVSKYVVDRIGIFYKKYKHGGADHDYSHQARKAKIPVLVTANVCGFCDKDHLSHNQIREKLLQMSLSERKKYFNNPVNCIYDYILGTWRRAPMRTPFVIIGRYLSLYCPSLYYKLSNIRK